MSKSPNDMISTIFMVLYVCVMLGIGIYLLSLAGRFVGAHERIASALERMANHRSHEERH